MRVDEPTTVNPRVHNENAVIPPTQERHQTRVTVSDTRLAELRASGLTTRVNLEKKLQEQISPDEALRQINSLPKPDSSDTAAVTAYKQKRAQIADNAIQNSQPPSIDDFKGLPPRLAEMEYRDALAGYSGQISQLKSISREARAYPSKILTPSDAVAEINNLPRPDRNDPAAIQAYNQQRADIANAALMYAEPPKRQDFDSLPPQLAAHEYLEAKADYDGAIAQLKEASDSQYSSMPPPITEAEADQAADKIIAAHGGRDHLDSDAIGKDLADLARTNPDDAAVVGQRLLDKIKGTDQEDNVSKAFVNNLSIDDLRQIAKDPAGSAFLESAKQHLLSGSVHSEEVDAASKIDEAVTGFNPQSLTGDPERDAKTIDGQLKSLPPDLRESYLKQLLDHPFGQKALRYATTMSSESQKALGEALGKLYQQDPSGTLQRLQQIADDPQGFPYYYQSGLAKVVAQSGNDDLIKAFAQHEIDKAKSDPEQVRGYLNAATAWAGLSPQALQDVMKNNPDFYKTVEEAGRLTQGPGNSGGFPNYNILETGLGDLLKKASQITGANGQSTPEALKLFATAIKYAGDNLFTQEGAGAFFIEHAKQVIDTYADPRNGGVDKANSFNPSVLQTFFAKVVYSPYAKVSQYNGQPMVDKIMGDGKGQGGVLGDVVETYVNEARQPNITAADRKNDQFIGEKIGYLWGAVSGGLLDSVTAYKDQFNQDKELRDFTFGLLKRGLGEIAKKFEIPGEIVDKAVDIGQKIYEAGKESDKQKQLDMFKQTFNEMTDSLRTYVTNLEVNDPNVEGLQIGFLAARTDYLTTYLVNDWIGR